MKLNLTFLATLLLTQLFAFPLAQAKPNIIVIFTDDQTYRGVGYHNPEVKTPHLDALAAGGITLERCYVASPICAASRASMMTGRFPQQHGVMGLGSKAFAPYQTGGDQTDQTLANRLLEAGYLTAFFGKSHLGKPTNYGFQVGGELRGHDDQEIFKQATQFVESQRDTDRPFFFVARPASAARSAVAGAAVARSLSRGLYQAAEELPHPTQQRQPQQSGRPGQDALPRFRLSRQYRRPARRTAAR